MLHRKKIIAVCLPGIALSAVLAAYHGTFPAPPSPNISLGAWIICACYGGILLLASWEEWVWLYRHLPRLPQRQQEPPQQEAGQKSADADTGAGAVPWEKLPVVTIPMLARTARESVIAFAQKHGLKPFEAERGFVLADNAGNYYKVALNP